MWEAICVVFLYPTRDGVRERTKRPRWLNQKISSASENLQSEEDRKAPRQLYGASIQLSQSQECNSATEGGADTHVTYACIMPALDQKSCDTS